MTTVTGRLAKANITNIKLTAKTSIKHILPFFALQFLALKLKGRDIDLHFGLVLLHE